MAEEFLWSLKNGDLEAIKKRCQKAGFDVNAEVVNGRNPLHYASDYGHKDVIEFLIKNGANVNLPDKYGITPILAAIYENHKDCVETLLSNGAKKDGKSPDGQSYLDCAESDDIKALLK